MALEQGTNDTGVAVGVCCATAQGSVRKAAWMPSVVTTVVCQHSHAPFLESPWEADIVTHGTDGK